MPSLGTPAGYAYHRDVLHEAASRLGMRVNQAQATSWIHEKNDKAPSRPGRSVQLAQHRKDGPIRIDCPSLVEQIRSGFVRIQDDEVGTEHVESNNVGVYAAGRVSSAFTER